MNPRVPGVHQTYQERLVSWRISWSQDRLFSLPKVLLSSLKPCSCFPVVCVLTDCGRWYANNKRLNPNQMTGGRGTRNTACGHAPSSENIL
jgi:hypothetical protein